MKNAALIYIVGLTFVLGASNIEAGEAPVHRPAPDRTDNRLDTLVSAPTPSPTPLSPPPVPGAGTLNDYNPHNVDIPADGSSVNSDLRLSGVPAEAEITRVKVYFEVSHTDSTNLDIWLSSYYDGGWHDHWLYHDGDLAGRTDVVETRDNIFTFNGASPNNTWYLCVRDNGSGGTGYIDFFELWISYAENSPPDTPYSPNPADNATGISVNTGLNWSCSDPDGDPLFYTVYLEKNNSNPGNVVKDDAPGASADPGQLDYGSRYFWRVEADDHKGGAASSPVWDFYTEEAPSIGAEITGISFDRTEVQCGGQGITAYVTLKNTGNQGWDFYVAGSSIRSGGSVWYDWSPSRAGKYLSPGQSGTVNLSWSPGAAVTTGSYDFYAKIYQSSSGSEYCDEDFISSAFEVIEPPISLNGRVAFHSYTDYLAEPVDGIDGNVFIYNLSDDTLVNVTGDLAVENSMNPHFSPDGSSVTFMAVPAGRPRSWYSLEIYVYDLAESRLVRLTDNGIPDEDPKYSPDGSHITWKRDRQIWEMEADGGDQHQLTYFAGEKSGPNYSPDGSRIVYWLNSGIEADVWIMNRDGTGAAALIAGAGLQEYYPIFRDGSNILYSRWESGSTECDKVYNYNLSSGQSNELPLNVSGVEDADAYPVDSTCLVFSSTRPGGKGSYDIYLGRYDSEVVYPLTTANSVHQDLGAGYSPFHYGRKLEVLEPEAGANLTAGSSCLLRVRAWSDGAFWTGAGPSVLLTGEEEDTYSGFEYIGNGIYSRTVTLPPAAGEYLLTAAAPSAEPGITRQVTSKPVSIGIYSPAPSATPTATPRIIPTATPSITPVPATPTVTPIPTTTPVPTTTPGPPEKIPHPVFGRVFSPDGSSPAELLFDAHIVTRPADVLDQDSPGSSSANGWWGLDIGNLENGWAAGETIHLNFLDYAGGVGGSWEYVITGNDPEELEDYYLGAALKETTILQTTTGTNVNAITLIDAEGIFTAADLADRVPNCGVVYRWNAVQQCYEGYVRGLPIGDFPVEPYHPYFISVSAPGSWSQTVESPQSLPSYSLITTARTNVNAVVLPPDKIHLKTGRDLLDDIPGAGVIYRWNSGQQCYEGYVGGLPINNFRIRIWEPYFISIEEEVSWP